MPVSVGKVAGGLAVVISAIPFLAVIGFTMVVIGCSMILDSFTAVSAALDEAVSQVGQSQVSEITSIVVTWASTVTTITIAFGALSLFVSVMSRGVIRDYFCNGSGNRLMSCLHCLVADCFPRFLTITTYIIFILMLLLVVVFTVLLTIVIVVDFACTFWSDLDINAKETLGEVESLTTLSEGVAGGGDAGAGGSSSTSDTLEAVNTLDEAIQSVCGTFVIQIMDAVLILVGDLLVVAGEVMLLMSLHASVALNGMQRKNGRAKRDADEDKLGNGETADYDGGYDAETPKPPPHQYQA